MHPAQLLSGESSFQPGGYLTWMRSNTEEDQTLTSGPSPRSTNPLTSLGRHPELVGSKLQKRSNKRDPAAQVHTRVAGAGGASFGLLLREFVGGMLLKKGLWKLLKSD